MGNHAVHVKFAGRIVFVGFGSIGQGVLPLILRHIGTSADRITIITAEDAGRAEAEQFGVKFVKSALTRDNYRQTLLPLLDAGDFLLNLSVDVSSVALILLARERGALYLDTCIEPWAGGYVDPKLNVETRSNYIMRLEALALRDARAERSDRRADAWRQSGPGFPPRQAGAAQHRQGHRNRGREAGGPRAMGEACANPGGQGHARRRARHADFRRAEEIERVRQHLVCGRFRQRGRAAGRTRVGHS